MLVLYLEFYKYKYLYIFFDFLATYGKKFYKQKKFSSPLCQMYMECYFLKISEFVHESFNCNSFFFKFSLTKNSCVIFQILPSICFLKTSGCRKKSCARSVWMRRWTLCSCPVDICVLVEGVQKNSGSVLSAKKEFESYRKYTNHKEILLNQRHSNHLKWV